MDATVLDILSKLIFGSSVILIIWIIYFEWRSAQIRAEKATIELGEKKNEDMVNSLTPDELLDLVNNGKEPSGSKGSSNTKKPTGNV